MNAPHPVPLLGWAPTVTLAMPGSKSVANRLLVLAALAADDGVPVVVRGVPTSDDVQHLLAGLRTLGYAVEHDAKGSTVTIGARCATAPDHGELLCGNAGTALRFLVSLAAITKGTWTLTGDAAMQRRPIGPLVEAWRQLGVDLQATNGCPPVRVRSDGPPRGGTVSLDARQSSQFVSSLLLVGSRLENGLDVTFAGDVASLDYARLTARTLAAFGIDATVDDRGARVRACTAAARALEVPVDGDWSAMGVWTCLAHATGARITGSNLRPASGQADEALAATLAALPRTGPHTLDVTPLPDQFLNLAVLAALRSGTTTFVGGANLRVKECDRLAVAARELRRLGADVDERQDGLVVRGGKLLHGGVVDPERDHRVAMAFALLGLLSPGVAIADPGCVAKSYPTFWRDLDLVLAHRPPLVLVGMRGSGKSTLARALVARTSAHHVDVDAQFVDRHGPIAAFVARQGWPAFRAIEAELVATALRPNTVVATGGGAVEHAETRHLLRQQARVLWLDAPLALLRARLAGDAAARPSLTGAPVLDELEAVLRRRTPLYAEVADVRLDAGLSLDAQCAAAFSFAAAGAAREAPPPPA
ncbi:MAG: 3-phosphoshikimate 1-carboxyvinyltransferase [Planctomycetes bacterium]|nr:3-phosphoshikimate 1-carboxyvinyltransferase [Planctomycetota bacterium]